MTTAITFSAAPRVYYVNRACGDCGATVEAVRRKPYLAEPHTILRMTRHGQQTTTEPCPGSGEPTEPLA